jgi:NADH-quinone oxidoreductase subunit D
MPEGDVIGKVPKVLRPPAGEVVRCVESPRGELGVHLVSDGTDMPYRFRYRAPSLFAMQVLEEIMPGHACSPTR